MTAKWLLRGALRELLLFLTGAVGLLAIVTAGTAVAFAVALLLSPEKAAASDETYVVDPSHIKNVYDGDTFYIVVPECAELLAVLCDHLGVRVNGIDTPEMHGKCQWERDHALAAKAVTAGMIKNAKSITLTHVEREKYGRLLANVEIDGVDLGATLIKGGYAREYHGTARTGWCKKRTTAASAPAPLPMKTAP